MFYSAQNNAFYSGLINGDMPQDVVEISDAYYAQLIQGQSDGNLIVAGADGLPALEAPPALNPPRVVTMRQARIALARSGLLPSVDAALAAMTGTAGDEARIEWEFSSMVERDRPLVQSLAVGLGLTDQQLDDLFALAASL